MQTVPLNQAVVTLTGGVLVSVLRWVGLTGGCATFFVALLFSHPLPARRLYLLSAVASPCHRINGAPFRIYLSNFFQELWMDKFALSCAVFTAEPPLLAMKGGSF